VPLSSSISADLY